MVLTKSFQKEITSVWSFPQRGNWATHNSSFRGNFAPQIPRNIIERYSNQGDIVLDPMVGGGTTGIECKLTGRNFIGMDINPDMLEITKKAMNFEVPEGIPDCPHCLEIGDVRELNSIEDNSIDLIVTHPPYANIIKYSNGQISGDLSNISSVDKFCSELGKGIKEFYRVLKGNHYCAILIGDTRKRKHYVPLSYFVMEVFLKNGFVLKEDIIKVQHNCKTTPYWQKQTDKYNFLLIMHEHLFVFRKPETSENLNPIKFSTYFKNPSKQ
ncbi:MAG: TRM11 family SAM-dependent methyltransferase [Actinomycetota bacterium]